MKEKQPILSIIIPTYNRASLLMYTLSFFKEHPFMGIGVDSGDLSFPDVQKIADAYGFPYFESKNTENLQACINASLACTSYSIAQIYVSPTQGVAPKVSTRQTENGGMVSARLEDMTPFLSREECLINQYYTY